MTGHARALRVLAAATAIAFSACRATPPSDTSATSTSGGELVAAIRTEPRNFSRLGATETTTYLVAMLLHAGLIRINRVTDEVEPWLAESWTRSADGRQYTIKLRPDVKFSDGEPLTSSDVLFSFEAAYRTGTSDSLMVNGKRLAVAAVDPLTVTVTFAAPFGPALRILDNLVVLPRHKLEGALKAGTLDKAWGLSTPPTELAGLGPFVLSEYQFGQRLVFVRNQHYWRKDQNGRQLPYLDRVTLEVVPDDNTQLLRLESAEIDAMQSEVPAEAYAPLKRAADAGAVRLYDLGPGLYPDLLWFNLKPGAFGPDPRAQWLQREEFRRAVSLAVDRQLFTDTVFLGAGLPIFGPVTPANKRWYWTGLPAIPHDAEEAKRLLTSIGLVDGGDGVRRDTSGKPARFTILTQKGRPNFERAVAVIRDELQKVGIGVDVAALEGNALIQQILYSRTYDAVYFNFFLSDTDPSLSADFWLSSGDEHFWNPGQKTPATAWEREIDRLIRELTVVEDPSTRKRLFDEVQRTFAEHQPAIYFAAPRIFAAGSVRLGNVTPAVTRPQLLWSPDTLTVAHR